MSNPFTLILSTIFSLLSTEILAAEANWVTSYSLTWQSGEPPELYRSLAYKKWKNNYFVLGKAEAKKYGLAEMNIRYSKLDVNNDGISEILVQEASWASSGYAFGMFEKKQNSWVAIEYHRGAFILTPNPNKNYDFLFIDRSGADYTSYKLKYTRGNYKLVKKEECEIGFNRFWALNWTAQENIKARARQTRPNEDYSSTSPKPFCIS